MPHHTPEDWDRQAERRNGHGRRWEDDLDAHKADIFAHAPLVDRLTLAGALIRQAIELRLSVLERFRAQATVIGAIALVILGAVAGVLTARLLQH